MAARSFDSSSLELIDFIVKYFGDTSEAGPVTYLERRGYVYDIADDVWHVTPGRTIDLLDAKCFKFLIEEYDWGPPVLFRYKPKKPYVQSLDIVQQQIECH